MLGTKTADEILGHIGKTIELEGERWRDEMRAGMAASNRGQRIEGAAYRPLALYSNQVAYNGSARVVGWSVRAVGGAATVTLHDGHDATADIVTSVGLSADGASSNPWFGPGGISFTEALFIEVTGTVAGSVFIGAVD